MLNLWSSSGALDRQTEDHSRQSSLGICEVRPSSGLPWHGHGLSAFLEMVSVRGVTHNTARTSLWMELRSPVICFQKIQFRHGQEPSFSCLKIIVLRRPCRQCLGTDGVVFRAALQRVARQTMKHDTVIQR